MTVPMRLVSITRLAFDSAIQHATTEGARAEFINSINQLEQSWESQARMLAEVGKAQADAEPDATTATASPGA